MVYTKSDGSFGFSWQQQYDFLLRESPEELENIVNSKLSLLKDEQPLLAEYYEELKAELNERIDEVLENPNFGYKESDEVVKAFIKEKELGELFDDVPTLLEPDEIFEDEDDELDDWLTEI